MFTRTPCTLRTVRCLISCLLFTTVSLQAQQTYPIYVTPSLTPPYSLTLSDYSQPGSQRLVVTIQVRDVTVTNLPVRLHLKIETMTGVTIETIPTAPVMPIYLSGGEVSVLFGDDMREYFNINNLQFKGYSKDEYRRTGQLPEGFWRFTVEVRHFSTGRLISNRGLAMAWIALGKPPVLKTPDNGAEVGQIAGMPLTFSWLPSNVGVPQVGTQYTFEMWEMRVPGIPPAVVASSMPVFYSSTQMNTSLVVHPAALMLEPGLNYAWRVTASDVMGQVPFAQGGHSEVRSFIYQCRCDSVTDFRVERQGQDITFRWEPSENNSSYNIEIENPASGWSKTDRVFDTKYETRSDPDKTYRARVQAICRGNEMNPGDFTTWRSITIPAVKTQQEICPDCTCDVPDIPAYELTNFTLRNDLQPGDTIVENYTRFVIASAKPVGNSTYEGQFWFLWEFYGKRILANYTNLQVNTDNQVVEYTWETVYDPKFLADVDAFKEYLDQLGDAVATLTPTDTVKLDFTIPENPEYHYNSENSTITIIDGAGSPHEIELPKNEEDMAALPAFVADAIGSVYSIDENGNMTFIPDAPDYAVGEWYKIEYLAALSNTIDWDAEDGKKITKGYTRNYFIIDPNRDIEIKLIRRTEANSWKREEYECMWYIDNECVNANPQATLFFNKTAGAYKIEARQNDTLLLTIDAVFIDSPEVIFQPKSAYIGEFGFDDNRYEVIAGYNEFEYLESKNNSKYKIPFMSLTVNEPAALEALVFYDQKKITEQDADNIMLEFAPSQNIKIASSKGKLDLTGALQCKLSDFQSGKLDLKITATNIITANENANILVKMGEDVVGKIQVISDQESKFISANITIVKVIVNGRLGNNINLEQQKNTLFNNLNERSYNQAFIKWDINIETQPLVLTMSEEERITIERINNEAKKEFPLTQNEEWFKTNKYVMFIAEWDKEDQEAIGLGTVRQDWNKEETKYATIHATKADNQTAIHELGHNLGLLDVGAPSYPPDPKMGGFKELFYDTKNFMDYSSNTNMFWKYQWKIFYEIIKKEQEERLNN